MNSIVLAELNSRPAGKPLREALLELLACDAYLLHVDANERSITYRLGMYLQRQLPHLHVDCEYNRDGIDPKRIQHLPLHPDSTDENAKTAFPDIIAHERGTNNNYLVVEIKKTTNKSERATDYAKLRGYRSTLGFQYAVFIELTTGGDKADVHTIEWIDT